MFLSNSLKCLIIFSILNGSDAASRVRPLLNSKLAKAAAGQMYRFPSNNPFYPGLQKYQPQLNASKPYLGNKQPIGYNYGGAPLDLKLPDGAIRPQIYDDYGIEDMITTDPDEYFTEAFEDSKGPLDIKKVYQDGDDTFDLQDPGDEYLVYQEELRKKEEEQGSNKQVERGNYRQSLVAMTGQENKLLARKKAAPGKLMK